jgi:CheY-like chemotaxis protein
VDTPSALRILIVEDLPDSANSMALLLQLWGYQSEIAQDGESACELAATFRPDVVFLDIGLPGIDGHEVARRIRKLPGMADALLVAITGYGRPADVQRCKQAGIDYHFLKPADPIELQKVLAKAEKLKRDWRQETC